MKPVVSVYTANGIISSNAKILAMTLRFPDLDGNAKVSGKRAPPWRGTAISAFGSLTFQPGLTRPLGLGTFPPVCHQHPLNGFARFLGDGLVVQRIRRGSRVTEARLACMHRVGFHRRSGRWRGT